MDHEPFVLDSEQPLLAARPFAGVAAFTQLADQIGGPGEERATFCFVAAEGDRETASRLR